jgi:hypothetical protein
MFRNSHAFISRKAIFSALLAATFSVSALANQPPSTGLGQAWPNTADVSVSPHFHVYVFARDGVRYIQVNDSNGTVLGAVAVADHVVLVLPVGVDEKYVTTSQAGSAAAQTAGNGESVYHDNATQITAQPADNGAVKLNVIEVNTCTSFDCTGQVVANPDTCTNFDCTGQVVSNKPSTNTCTNFDCTGQVISNTDPCTSFDCTGQAVSKTGQ